MDRPAEQLAHVVRECTGALHESADVQRAAIERYYAPDCEFNHPLCRVSSAPSSRDDVLRVYQWYRIMSPTLKLAVDEVVLDEKTDVAYLQVTQTFHLRWSPLKPAPARLVVKVNLVRDGGLWYISRQEDFYQPEDLLYLTIPPLAHIVILLKGLTATACKVYAVAGQSLGFWRTDQREQHDKDD
ncbi:hypothetical protein AURDEDRAFT_113076 [Auricularia subglabra TFB-10046 SS5]|nr:hypothetical protein AURDEDRAFT_113076 [Auricularia subglabra TFB-10046 SS5]